jgi:hypothetical protein
MAKRRGKVPHPFLEPRFLAAFAVLAAFVSLGVGLILSKFIVAGAAVTVAGLACAVSIYWRHFAGAFSALRYRRLYSGINPIELLVVLVLLVATVTGTTALALFEAQRSPLFVRSFLVEDIQRSPIPSSDMSYVRVHLWNRGGISAKDFMGVIVAGLSPRVHDPADVQERMRNLSAVVVAVDSKATGHNEIVPTIAVAIDAYDWSPIKSAADLEPAVSAGNILRMTNSQWDDVTAGRSLLYVLYVVRYTDDAIGADEFWEIDGCQWYIGAIDTGHYCTPSVPELRTGHRRAT